MSDELKPTEWVWDGRNQTINFPITKMSDVTVTDEGTIRDLWYRQGKDDGAQIERERIVAWLREQDGHGYDDMRAIAIETGEHNKKGKD